MFQQDLWSAMLAGQFAVILSVAAVTTVAAIWLLPAERRGWPVMVAVAALGCALACGIAASLSLALIAIICLVLGDCTFLLAGIRDRTDAWLRGTTGLGTLLLLFSTCSVLQLPLLVVFCVVVSSVVLGIFYCPRLRLGLLPHWPVEHEGWTVSRAIVAWAILAAALFYGANAALPERFWDPLVMHLMIPTQILDNGHWTFDPNAYAFAFFPMSVDYLFTFAMAMGGERAAKLVNLAAFFTTLILLRDVVRPWAGSRIAEQTVLLLLALPIALMSATTTMVEAVLALQIVAAFRALLLMRGGSSRAALVALAVIVPSMVSIKLHGGVAAVPILLCVILSRPRPPVRDWVVAACAAIPDGLASLSQYVWAWSRTGNPVFPFMNNRFHSPFWPAEALEDARWTGHLTWKLLYRMTFNSPGFLESYNGALGFAFLLFLLPGVIACVLAPRAEPVFALVISAVYLAVLLPQIQYIRYIYPIMPLLLVVCAHALAALTALKWTQWLGLGAVGVAASAGLFALPSGAWTLRAADLRAAYDPNVRHALLLAQVPSRLAVDAINASSAGTPRVIFAGEPYGAMLRGTPIYTDWYNLPLHTALGSATDPAAVRAVIEAQHPDFIIASPQSGDAVERAIVAFAERFGVRVPLSGSVALWRMVGAR